MRLGLGSLAAAIAAGGLAIGMPPVPYVGDPPLLNVSSISPLAQLLAVGAGLALLTAIISFVMALMAGDK